MRRLVLAVASLLGCGRPDGFVRDTFEGVEFAAPKGTHRGNSGVTMPSHYPDPETGEVITIPTRIEPAITLIMPDQHRYYVELKKPPERVTLEGMQSSMRQQPGASDVGGKAEPDGWTCTYKWTQPDGSVATIIHRRFVFADSDYQCQYDTASSPDVETARRICASIRPLRPR